MAVNPDFRLSKFQFLRDVGIIVLQISDFRILADPNFRIVDFLVFWDL